MEITGLAYDSRSVRPGSLFFCVSGHRADGHDFAAIRGAFAHFATVTDRPKVLIADTIKGKGVSFMEGDYLWHGKPPKKDEADIALRELLAARAKIGAGRG